MDTLDRKSVERSSQVAQFSPFFGHHVLIRSSGWLRQLVKTIFHIRRPLVWDARLTCVKLLLWHTQLKNHHQGINYLRSKVQELYAALKLRSTRCSTRCVESSLLQPFNRSWQTSQRRDCRTSLLPLRTRVEYFGPFYVTVRRTTEKKWRFLFTCLTTRAIHVEFVPSMNTFFYVMWVEWFDSRRGTLWKYWKIEHAQHRCGTCAQRY